MNRALMAIGLVVISSSIGMFIIQGFVNVLNAEKPTVEIITED